MKKINKQTNANRQKREKGKKRKEKKRGEGEYLGAFRRILGLSEKLKNRRGEARIEEEEEPRKDEGVL